MEAVESVALLDDVERGVHQVQLEHRLARGVVAGSPVNPDACKVNRRRSGALGEVVGPSLQVFGVDIFGVTVIDPGPGLDVESAELVALEENHRAPAFTASGGKVVADAEIATMDLDPYGLRRRRALLAGNRDATHHIVEFDDLGA